MLGSAEELKSNKGMQRNPYWPFNGPSFFLTTEIPSQCISLAVQVAQSASGLNFAARMAWYWIGTYRTRERLAFNIRSSSTPIPTHGRLIFAPGLFGPRVFLVDRRKRNAVRRCRHEMCSLRLPKMQPGLRPVWKNMPNTGRLDWSTRAASRRAYLPLCTGGGLP